MAPDALASRREDELAIRDLANRYARMIDRRDWPELPRVFTPDCELSGQGYLMRGHAELDRGLRKIDMFSATQHCVLNQVTQLDGDRATGEFYCIANHIANFNEPNNGIGHLRSENRGSVSETSGNRAPGICTSNGTCTISR